jgi:hypothetical protein
MTRRPFLPTARQLNVLLTVGFLSLGYALYVRYLVIENSTVGLACDTGLATWLCWTRKTTVALFNHMAFGLVALSTAVLHVIRPSIVLLVIALAAAGFGIVLYNVALSSLAIAFLILGLARPQVVEEQ